MSTPNTDAHQSTGLAVFRLTREEREHPVWRKFEAAMRDEQAKLRRQLEPVQNIESTTLLRGELQLAKRILARADEVGPESRQSEPQWPESALPARSVTGLPEGY